VVGYQLADDRRHCTAVPWKLGAPFLVYAQVNRCVIYVQDRVGIMGRFVELHGKIVEGM